MALRRKAVAKTANQAPRRRMCGCMSVHLKDDLLGHTQFPGGPKATDGLVLDNKAFGTSGTARAPVAMFMFRLEQRLKQFGALSTHPIASRLVSRAVERSELRP